MISTEQALAARRARLTGLLLMCGAVACFSCLDSMAKYLSRHMDVLEVVWARYTFAFILALILSNPFSRPGLMRTTRPVLQVGAAGKAPPSWPNSTLTLLPPRLATARSALPSPLKSPIATAVDVVTAA